MDLKITGELEQILPKESGESSRGSWAKQNFVIKTEDDYPKQICVTVWNDLTDKLIPLEPGTILTVSINIESREYKERWYTDIKAWKIENEGLTGQRERQQAEAAQLEQAPNDPEDDLPF